MNHLKSPMKVYPGNTVSRESCKNVELWNCGIVELGKTPRERMGNRGNGELARTVSRESLRDVELGSC